MYINFWHGRKDPKQQMEETGFNGPIIGPVNISWTYGTVKIHNLEWFEFEHLEEAEGCIKLGEDYFGDFEILEDTDPLLEANPERIISYEEMMQKYFPTSLEAREAIRIKYGV